MMKFKPVNTTYSSYKLAGVRLRLKYYKQSKILLRTYTHKINLKFLVIYVLTLSPEELTSWRIG